MLRLLIQNISEIVVVIDRHGIIRFSNPQLERILGLRTEDAVGRNIFEFIHPDDLHRAGLEYSVTVLKPGEGVPSRLRIRDAAGEWIPFEIIANNQLEDPDIRGVIFTARDLRSRREVDRAIRVANADVEKRIEERTTELAKLNTELRLENQSRRETERRLQQTISLLDATLNSTADGLLVISTDGTVTGCNRRFLEMWRLQVDSPVGREDTDLLDIVTDQLQDPDAFISKVNALYSDPGAISSDILTFKDGRIYERYSQPQRLGDRIVGRVWSFRDVTEARRLEEELRQSQKLEAIGRLAGGVAHDFNNLLMLISGYLDRLSEPGLSAEQEEAYEQAVAATKRAASLTRQLLAFTRKHRDAPTVTNLNLVISNVQGMLQSLVSENTRLAIRLASNPVPILADVIQLEVIIMNLAINAQDAMPNGGTLAIVSDTQVEGSETFAVLTVSDTGTGIPPEVRSRIFEPFFTTKEVGKGTGLGLSTVYGAVQRSGGRIEVHSEPEQGTQFRILLPETKSAPAISAVMSRPAPPVGGRETILLAEDEPGIRAMTRAYLESLGYYILEASDGSEAVKIAASHEGSIDLIVTDLLMPVLQGDAVVGAIRETRPNIKALYVSGCLEDLEADESTEVLLKPFEFPELGRRVRSILDVGPKLQKLA